MHKEEAQDAIKMELVICPFLIASYLSGDEKL